ncbi:uncharacterized protein LOC127287489 [Leptopilina boulardi]|uniref:uncharacterized protein LOC127287489 n=1 Tax=Leptopilina boulardi TaxID=63433 RepID=UPI0021F5B6DB|nr:uncharacterized protein LOC127287489 [Leptopilina boulardi]
MIYKFSRSHSMNEHLSNHQGELPSSQSTVCEDDQQNNSVTSELEIQHLSGGGALKPGPDFLTGGSSFSNAGLRGGNMPTPMVPLGAKRKRNNLQGSYDSNSANTSAGSFDYVPKRANEAPQSEPQTTSSNLLSDLGDDVPDNFIPPGPVLWDQEDLEWHSDSVTPFYNDFSPSPYLVLMESTRRGMNVGKLDPVSVIDWQSANALVTSKDLILAGFKVFIPESFLRKKGFTTVFPSSRSIRDIIRICEVNDLANITNIKRLVDDRNNILDRVEFTFNGPTVPRNIQLGGFTIQITPIIQRPRRCYRCQRFCHVANQCRSAYPSCEFCAGQHLTNVCPNGHLSPLCKNCKRNHIASSTKCTIFKMEFGIRKHRYTSNCNRDEAKLAFYAENPDLVNNLQSRDEISPSPHNSRGNQQLPFSTQETGTSTPLNVSYQNKPRAPDRMIEISMALHDQQITDRLQVVNALIDLNQSHSAIISALQDNLSVCTRNDLGHATDEVDGNGS